MRIVSMKFVNVHWRGRSRVMTWPTAGHLESPIHPWPSFAAILKFCIILALSMLAILALSASSFLAPFTARRVSTLNAHNDRATHLMLNAPDGQQLAIPEAVQTELVDVLAASCANGNTMPIEAVTWPLPLVWLPLGTMTALLSTE